MTGDPLNGNASAAIVCPLLLIPPIILAAWRCRHGPSTTLRVAVRPTAPCRYPAARKGKLHDEDPANVFPVVHVLVALVDAFKRIGAGAHGVQIQLAVFVQVQQHWHVGPGVDRAEDTPDDLLLPLREPG